MQNTKNPFTIYSEQGFFMTAPARIAPRVGRFFRHLFERVVEPTAHHMKPSYISAPQGLIERVAAALSNFAETWHSTGYPRAIGSTSRLLYENPRFHPAAYHETFANIGYHVTCEETPSEQSLEGIFDDRGLDIYFGRAPSEVFKYLVKPVWDLATPTHSKPIILLIGSNRAITKNYHFNEWKFDKEGKEPIYILQAWSVDEMAMAYWGIKCPFKRTPPLSIQKRVHEATLSSFKTLFGTKDTEPLDYKEVADIRTSIQ